MKSVIPKWEVCHLNNLAFIKTKLHFSNSKSKHIGQQERIEQDLAQPALCIFSKMGKKYQFFWNEALQIFFGAGYWSGIPTGVLLNDRINIHFKDLKGKMFQILVLQLADLLSMTVLVAHQWSRVWFCLVKQAAEQMLHRKLFTWSNNEKKDTESMSFQTAPFGKASALRFSTDTQSLCASLFYLPDLRCVGYLLPNEMALGIERLAIM